MLETYLFLRDILTNVEYILRYSNEMSFQAQVHTRYNLYCVPNTEDTLQIMQLNFCFNLIPIKGEL